MLRNLYFQLQNQQLQAPISMTPQQINGGRYEEAPLPDIFDPEAINERLGAGDLTALEDLDKFRIAYTQEERNGKTIIKYEYNGTKYTINCYPPQDNSVDDTQETAGDDSVEDTDGVGEDSNENQAVFSSYSELRNFVFGNECRALIKGKGIADFSQGFVYENVAETVSKQHADDYASVSKEQLIDEFVAEYNRLIGENSAEETTGDFESYDDLYWYAVEAQDIVLEKLGVTEAEFKENCGKSFGELRYEVVNKHINDYASITEEQIVEEMIEAYNAEFNYQNNSDANFRSHNELILYLYDNDEFKNSIFENLDVKTEDEFKAKFGVSYIIVCSDIWNSHREDFASVTKAMVQEEFLALCSAYKSDNVDESDGSNKPGSTEEPDSADEPDNVDEPNSTEEPDSVDESDNVDEPNSTEEPDSAEEPGNEVGTNGIKDAAQVVEGILSTVKNRDLSSIISGQSTIHTEFGMDAYGNIVFQESKTKQVFDYLFESVKKRILEQQNGDEVLQQLGGEGVLKKLVQSAWIANYADFDSSKSNTAANFVYGVLNKLTAMMQKIQENPDNIELYTTRSSYADTELTNSLIHYNTNTTYGGDEKISYAGTVKTDSDGTVHIANEKDDPDYQATMSALLQRLKEKYPNVDEASLKKIFQAAQKEALSILQGNLNDCPYGTGNNSGRVEDGVKNWGGNDNRKDDDNYIHMDELVQITLYCFDKQFINAVNEGTINAQKVDNVTNDNTKPNTPSSDPVKAISEDIEEIIPEVLNKDLAKIIGNNSTIHTEFGMDKNGNIVFQEAATTGVFTRICTYIQQELLKICNSTDYEKFGGNEVVKQLVQTAWITAYNSFDSSQSNNSTAFVTQVLDNLQKMMQKIQENPDNIELYTTRGSYTDTELTNSLIHYNTKTTYGGDETISYAGTVKTDSDGTVHIANEKDDPDYQATMSALLQRLKEKYPNVDEASLKKIFQAAQKEALSILQGNLNDCPYGTGNNSGRVEDGVKNWGGKDNRKDDGNNIHMDELVQITLYCFDKQFFKAINDGAVNAQKVGDVTNDNTKPNTPSSDPVKAISEDAEEIIPEVLNKDLAKIIGNNSTIHTEFGMDKNGNIVFQNSETFNVFTRLCSYMHQELMKVCNNTDYSKFGGYAVLTKLVQAAWIASYNSFNSSQSNNSTAFVTKVLENLQKMMQKIQDNPELLSTFTQQTSYADNSLTDNLIHYNTKTTAGGDEIIIYDGKVTTDSSGKVHIANSTDDNDYQFTMDALLERLFEKYPLIDKNTITNVFRSAQKLALSILQGDTNDCPYGTGNNAGMVEDTKKDWGGNDNRKGDGGKIYMDELVQMTLYCFDKLLYKQLLS